MKVVTRVKGLLAAAVAAAGLVAFAEPVVEITKAWQANPGSGVVDFTYEVRDLDGASCDLVVRVEAKGCDKTYTFTNENVSAGSVTTNVDYKTMLGMVSPNVSIYASLVKCQMRGVQLWEGGPFWAECNVGAESPEETGYYFWWGDTVGYVRNESNNGWVSADGKGTVMDFNGNNALSNLSYLKSETDLKNEGWIDANTNLVAKHDAARVHLGGGWRLPTLAEIVRLEKCAGEGATNWKGTGKAGRVIKGTGSCSTNSIFLPLTGYGVGPNLNGLTTEGALWTATPTFDAQNHYANKLGFGTSYHGKYTNVDRYIGLPIRAVRDAE